MIYAVAPPDSRIVTPLILTLFSQRLLDACKKSTLIVSTCLPTTTRILASFNFRVCQTLNPHQSILQDGP
jgi:hypothetical protein